MTGAIVLRQATAVLGVLCILTTHACGRDHRPLRVSAAASLADVLPPVARAWRRRGGPEVAFNFDATPRLARQIRAGAPSDVVVSADVEWVDTLEHEGLVLERSRRRLLGNELVTVVPAARAGAMPRSAGDLAAPRFARIAIAGPNVPAGRYAHAALRSAGALDRLAPRFIEADSVRSALAWAARAEVDAAIVYRTDALAERRVTLAFTFPESSHPPIVYEAAVVRRSAEPEAAADFIELCASDETRGIFERAGFRVLR